MGNSNSYHESVMVQEVIENLHINKGSQYIDATLGTGGHTLEIIKAGGKVLGIEADPKMLAIAQERISDGNFVLGNFVSIDKLAQEKGFEKVAGIVLDLGISNIHFLDDDRGFGFGNSEAVLDMRLNPETQGVRAQDLLNALRSDQLINLFEVTMESGNARWLTKQILERRPINTVNDFLKICKDLRGKPGISSATLPFLALRIAVNSELDNLQEVLSKAFDLLEPSGRLVVISFHSGEDRIVKNFTRNSNFMHSTLILPSNEEIARNPRARSAKLRVFEK